MHFITQASWANCRQSKTKVAKPCDYNSIAKESRDHQDYNSGGCLTSASLHCHSRTQLYNTGAKPEGYITVHEATQMRGLTQHPTSKVAWELQGPSVVQQCQYNGEYIMHSNSPSQEITTVPWQWPVAAKYIWLQPCQGQHVYDQLPLYAPSIS